MHVLLNMPFDLYFLLLYINYDILEECELSRRSLIVYLKKETTHCWIFKTEDDGDTHVI